MNDSTKKFWEANYRRNIDKIIGICYRYTRNRSLSEDLAHEAFLKAIEKYKSFEGKGHFDAWLRRIVVNHTLQHLRDAKVINHGIELQLHNELNTTENEAFSSDAATFSIAELLDSIEQLPEHHRWVFDLYVIEKYTHAQIANQLDISEGTSKSHLARARKKLKKLLEERAKEHKEDKEYQKWLLLLVSPYGYEHLSQLFETSFNQFSIPAKNPLNSTFITSNSPNKLRIASSKASFKLVAVFGLVIISTISILVIQLWKSDDNKYYNSNIKKASAITTDSLVEKQSQKKILPESATISKDTVKSNSNKKHSTMKPLDSLALLIVLSTSSLSSTALQDSVRHQIETVQLTPIKKPDASNQVVEEEKGTFSASRLFWSKDNNEVYLKGNVRVYFENSDFQGNGSFTFLGKVYLLVINGQQIEVGKTIKLSNANYKLVRLHSNEAIAKYGEKGKKGAIEISSIK